MNKTGINPNKLLPLKYRIPNAGNHIYEIGFIRQQIGEYCTNKVKYNLYKRHLLKFIYISHMIKFIITANIRDTHKYRNILIIIGDLSIGLESIRIHYNIFVALLSLFCLLTQLLHERFSSPSSSWLRPFAMMKGLITPSDVGLNDSNEIIKFIKR